MAQLYRATEISDFENYFKVKSDPIAVKWSGFSEAPDKDRLLKHFEKILNNPETYLFYLFNDCQLIGYGQLESESKTEIKCLGISILSEFQGKGFGREITTLLTEKASELGFSKMSAWISENNAPSMRSFIANDFTQTTESKLVKLNAFDRTDRFLLLEKYL